MKVITRKCMVVAGALAVLAVYTAGAYRNELARQAPMSPAVRLAIACQPMQPSAPCDETRAA